MQRLVIGGLWLLLVTGCGAPVRLPAAPMPTATSLPPDIVLAVGADTLPDLIRMEREASIAGNLPLLAALWAEDGRIVDGRGTAESHDDYVWQGRAAILDRYTLAVFPAPPPPLTVADLATANVVVEGDTATLANGGDRWRFVRQEGRWWLQQLVYNAP